VINLKNASHEISAEIVVPEGGAQGVVVCQGGNMAGWSLYLDQGGHCTYLYNWFGHVLTTLRDPQPLAAGKRLVSMVYLHDGGFGAGGQAALFVDGSKVSTARIERTVPIMFSMSGETFDVGRDTGSPVGPYPHQFPCTALISWVELERLSEPDAATRLAMAEGEFRAVLSAQ
jgi:arylsulfatase